MSMEEYANSRHKKEIQSINITKASNGYVVTVSNGDYNEKKSVYDSIDGVVECVRSKLGGKREGSSSVG